MMEKRKTKKAILEKDSNHMDGFLNTFFFTNFFGGGNKFARESICRKYAGGGTRRAKRPARRCAAGSTLRDDGAMGGSGGLSRRDYAGGNGYPTLYEESNASTSDSGIGHDGFHE